MINLYDNIKGRRINQKQKNILYAAMAINRKVLEFGSGDSASDVRQARKAVWKRVMLQLNMAGPEKDISQWKKVWTDLRLGMRKKWDKALKSEYMLTEYERRVISACGMIEKSGDEDFEETSADEINSFLNFLEEEQTYEEYQEHSNVLPDGNSNSNSQYLADSTEFIICQPTDIDVKEDFDEPTNHVEYQESSVEFISDDEQATKFEEFREPSVESISDDEDFKSTNNMKLESPTNLPYEEPLLTETVSKPMPLKFPEIPLAQVPASPLNKINLTRRKKLKDATLKEIRKMHRNLLRESKKQTALLRKLVQRMQQ